MRDLIKSTLSVSSQGTGRSFVFQLGDKQDMNHRPTDNAYDTTGEGRLCKVTGHHLFPVSTFQQYISKLYS